MATFGHDGFNRDEVQLCVVADPCQRKWFFRNLSGFASTFALAAEQIVQTWTARSG